jgi:adenylate kinase
MDKIAKFEYQQNIEQYLEDKQVFETLEGLLKSLIVHRPEKPIEYLMERL